MEFPKIVIDLEKLKKNCELVVKECKKNKVTVTAITKAFCAKPEIAQVFLESGVNYLGDSRLYNLKKIKHLNIPKVLIRIPMKSTARDVVKYSDISLNSEISIIEELDKYAKLEKKIHKVILMIELGDLREGVLEKNVSKIVKDILKLKNIKLYGVGVNLTCYGGIIPDESNLGRLIKISEKINNEFGIKIKMVTGGNSSSYYLLQKGQLPKGINNLRLGESLILGRESAYGKKIQGSFDDAFTLFAEIIELKEKESLPTGEVGKDAFGNVPEFQDKGKMLRGILAVGRQDTEISGMFPKDSDLEIMGASSDHLIMDFSKSNKKYKVGDVLEFKLDYASLLRLMTSEYINKEYKDKNKIMLEQCNY